MAEYPPWWANDVRVVGREGQRGTIGRAGVDGWLVHLDGDDSDSSYIVNPSPDYWEPEVRQLLTPPQRDRIVHDAERALLRAFGCHYVPEWEMLPERVRIGAGAHPRAVGRPELDGLQAVIRGAMAHALAPYVRGV